MPIIGPLVGATGKAATVKTGMSATSGRRVITFLPPPLHPTNTERPAVLGSGRRAYPSPTHSSPQFSSSPLRPEIHDTTSSPAVEQSHGPLSPPPSDQPTPSMQDHEDDILIKTDLETIGRMYPGVKATWREVRDYFSHQILLDRIHL